MSNEAESAIIRLAREYVKKNKERVSRLKVEAQKILDENYRGVYAFFCDVLEKKKAYKILRARRCQVLFMIFLPIILLEEDDGIEITGEFISSHTLFKYKDEIRNSSGIIVDDIVIHGSGLKKTYELLDDQFECSNIRAFVYAKRREAELCNELAEKLEARVNAFEQEWRSLSTQFVNLIYACVSPYISYVESSYEYADFKGEGLDEDFLILNNTNRYQELQGETSLVLFEKEEKVPLFFKKLGYDCCLRIYIGKALGMVRYIPYIFIKNMRVSLMSDIIKKVCAALPKEKAENIMHDLLEEHDADERCQAVLYKMKLFNALMNHAYGLYLKHEYNSLQGESVPDKAVLVVCYGEKIQKEFSRLEYEDVSGILDLTIEDFAEAEINEDEELDGILSEIDFSDGESFEGEPVEAAREKVVKEKLKKLQEYFYKDKQIDEELARRNRNRLRKQGLSLGKFYSAADVKDIHWMSVSQLNAWDSGIASCDIICNANNVVFEYAASGEQSFRYVLERHSTLFADMIYAYNSPLWLQTEETGEELAEKVYNQYLSEAFSGEMNKDKTREREMLESFVAENMDKLNDWEIPEIFAEGRNNIG